MSRYDGASIDVIWDAAVRSNDEIVLLRAKLFLLDSQRGEIRNVG